MNRTPLPTRRPITAAPTIEQEVRKPVSKERAAEILAYAGFKPKTF